VGFTESSAAVGCRKFHERAAAIARAGIEAAIRGRFEAAREAAAERERARRTTAADGGLARRELS
jgi:hypothetical protein